MSSDDTRFVATSVKRTRALRKDVFVGVSGESFAAAVENAWEAAKRLSPKDSVPEQRDLLVVAQWATGRNPITEFCVVTIGWPPTG